MRTVRIHFLFICTGFHKVATLARPGVSQSEKKQMGQNMNNNKLLKMATTIDGNVDECLCEGIKRYPQIV